jgi:cytoskeletal protein CcmA (bactofilin family)
MFSKKPAPSFPGAHRSMPNAATFSVIAADVVIRGNVEATTDLHIDGTIEGDIACATVVQGEGSRVEGAIEADRARLSGTVNGTVTVRELVVLRSARIEGDVHYETLTVEQGASLNGRLAAAAQPQPLARALKSNGLGDDDEPRLTLAG